MRMRVPPWWLAMAWLAAVLPGCGGDPPRLDADRRPGDFALRLTVIAAGDDGGHGDAAATEPGQYIVTPDRWLRAAVGEGATASVYPGRTARLSPAAMDRLWRLAAAAARSPRPAPSSNAMRVSGRLTGEGGARRFEGTLDQPAVRALVAELVRMRGGAMELK